MGHFSFLQYAGTKTGAKLALKSSAKGVLEVFLGFYFSKEYKKGGTMTVGFQVDRHSRSAPSRWL